MDPRDSVLKAPEPRSRDRPGSANTEPLTTRHPRRDDLTFVEQNFQFVCSTSSRLLRLQYNITLCYNLYLKGHPNPIAGSKVKPILLNGWILPIGGASAVEGLQSTGIPRLVLIIVTLSKLFSPN